MTRLQKIKWQASKNHAVILIIHLIAFPLCHRELFCGSPEKGVFFLLVLFMCYLKQMVLINI